MSDINVLFKNDGLQEPEISDGSKKCQQSKNKIDQICKSIAISSQEYNPLTTIKTISEYVNDDNCLTRILYSQVSSFVFGLDDDSLDNYINNGDKLLEYALDEKNNIEKSIQNIIIKIYDHSNLARQQKLQFSKEELAEMSAALNGLRSAHEQMSTEIKKTESEYKATVKNTQREYISIFGVFSAIIITFVGGLSFTTSVMDGINSASPYRLVFIVALIGFVIINLVHYLVRFLWRISGNSEDKNLFIILVNVFFILLFVLDAIVFFIAEKTTILDNISDFIYSQLFNKRNK